MAVVQKAGVRWEGTIARGAGALHAASGALDGLEVDLPTRMGEAGGKTTPEELLAASHATCFAMALGSVLARERTPPEQLHVDAEVTLETEEGNRRISGIALEVRARVPDADAGGFQAALGQAEELCLISRTLKGNVDITARGTLA
jgi:osmotically inducible protein OsmC